MTCYECKLLTSEYLDNLLAAKQRAAYEKHLADCQQCRQEAEATTAAIKWLRQADTTLEPPASIRTNVIAALLRQQRNKLAPGFKQFVAAAAIFVLLLAGNILAQTNLFVTSLSEQEAAITLEYSGDSKAAEELDTQSLEGKGVTGSPMDKNDEQLQHEDEQTETDKYISPLILLNLILLPLLFFFLWQGWRQRRRVLP